MNRLVCTRRDGTEETFAFTFSEIPLSDPIKWQFNVTTEVPQSDGAFFELTVEEIDDRTVRIVMMNNYKKPAYLAKGIPDALIPAVRQALKRVGVESSPSNHPDGGIFRTKDATKVWKRLEAKGVAAFDSDRDIYRLV